jgi:RNA polymerase sigma-70 factor (family 1)
VYLYGKQSLLVQTAGQEYWALIRSGDKASYEHLFRTYYQPLCNYASTLTRNIDEAEEAVQNVFFNLWHRRESLKSAAPAKAYLYRAVHNECINRLKHWHVKRGYETEIRAGGQANENDTVSQEINAKELSRQIDHALESLPPQCGEVFRMNRFGNLKYAEIAVQLNISVKTVEAHMGKAIRIMRDKLKDFLPALIGFYLLMR